VHLGSLAILDRNEVIALLAIGGSPRETSRLLPSAAIDTDAARAEKAHRFFRSHFRTNKRCFSTAVYSRDGLGTRLQALQSGGTCPGAFLHNGAAIPASGHPGWQVAGMRSSNRPTAPVAVCVGPRFVCCCSSDTVWESRACDARSDRPGRAFLPRTISRTSDISSLRQASFQPFLWLPSLL
jgi:hypothetical protein